MIALFQKSVFRALKHANYRRFFIGQGISLIGVWMQQIAEVWLAYRLTHSAFYLGVVGFASQLPIFLLAPIAGVWIDRVDRRKLLITTQLLEMAQALALAILTLTHHITIPWLIVLSTLGGIVDAVDIPTRQSLVIRMVEDRADLPNAIALNSSLVNMARLLGPSIAGLLIAMVGEGWCFFINGLSYLPIIFALTTIHTSEAPRPAAEIPVLRELRQGWRYITHSPPISILLILLACVSLITSANSVLIPIFATQILQGDAHTLGFLMAGSGLGALTAALHLAARSSVRGLPRWIAISVMLLGCCLCLFSFSRVFWLSWLAIAGAGFGMMTSSAAINTVLQTIVDEDKRGRVMSFFATAFIGVAPLGNLVGGYAGNRWGVTVTVFSGSLLCMTCAVLFAFALPRLRAHIRPIYVRLGIIPEVAKSLENVTPVKS